MGYINRELLDYERPGGDSETVTNERTDGRTDGRTNGRTEGRKEGIGQQRMEAAQNTLSSRRAAVVG